MLHILLLIYYAAVNGNRCSPLPYQQCTLPLKKLLLCCVWIISNSRQKRKELPRFCCWSWNWSKVWRLSRHSLGHIRGGLHSQSLDWYWQTKQYKHKLNTTQKQQTTQNTAKTKQPWFSHLLRFLARKWDGLILQRPRAYELFVGTFVTLQQPLCV